MQVKDRSAVAYTVVKEPQEAFGPWEVGESFAAWNLPVDTARRLLDEGYIVEAVGSEPEAPVEPVVAPSTEPEAPAEVKVEVKAAAKRPSRSRAEKAQDTD